MYRPKKLQTGGSIYDYLVSKGTDGSYAHRKKYYSSFFKNEEYTGTAEQNQKLLAMFLENDKDFKNRTSSTKKPAQKAAPVPKTFSQLGINPINAGLRGLDSSKQRSINPIQQKSKPTQMPVRPASLPYDTGRAATNSTYLAPRENIKRVPIIDTPTIPERISQSIDWVVDRGIGKFLTSEKEDAKLVVKDQPIQPQPKGRSIPYGYTQLGAVPDRAAGDSLVSFRNIFDNDDGGRYLVGHSLYEHTNDKIDNAEAVAHFIMDGDILPGQKNPGAYADAKGKVIGSSVPGKFINYTNTGDPNQFVMGYKPNKDGSYNIVYRQNKEITPEERSAFTFDLGMRAHPYSQINWEAEGNKTGFAAYSGSTKYVPLKNGQSTSLPYKDKDAFSRFSGGSGIYTFRDPESGKRVGVDVSGSVNVISNEGKRLLEQYNLSPDSLQFLYHDMGSYSAKPKAKNGQLNYNQWKNYNTHNRGRSGAPIVIPKQQLGGLTFDPLRGTTQSGTGRPIRPISINTNIEDPLAAAMNIMIPGMAKKAQSDSILDKDTTSDMAVYDSKQRQIGNYVNEEYVPLEKKPYDWFSPYYGMRATNTLLSEIAGRVDKRRQDQYFNQQQANFHMMNPDEIKNYQPNPYSMYAKYGGSLKKYMGKC